MKTIEQNIKAIISEWANLTHGESCGANYYGVKEWTCRCGVEKGAAEDTKAIMQLFKDESKAQLMKLLGKREDEKLSSGYTDTIAQIRNEFREELLAEISGK